MIKVFGATSKRHAVIFGLALMISGHSIAARSTGNLPMPAAPQHPRRYHPNPHFYLVVPAFFATQKLQTRGLIFLCVEYPLRFEDSTGSRFRVP